MEKEMPMTTHTSTSEPEIEFQYGSCPFSETRSTLCSKKSDAKIQITINMAHLIRINYPLSSFNYRLSGTNIANFNKIRQ